MVVLDHTMLALDKHSLRGWDPARLGTLGVFIFFVHTSLVLMWSLERKPDAEDFYIRRIFRIYPLAILAITVALTTRAPVLGGVNNFFEYHHVSAHDALANYLLVQNLGNNTSSVLNVLWTLPFEVQMYVFLPMLFYFARFDRSIWPLLLVWLLVAKFCTLKFVDPDELNLATVIPIFLPGVIAYGGFKRWKARLPSWLLFLLLTVLISFAMHHPTNRNGWYFALLLGLLLPHFKQVRIAWLVRAGHEVAKYSYGIYLSHPFALVLGMYLLRGQPLALQLAVEVLTIALVSVVTYHVLEEPLIVVGKRVASLAETHLHRTLPG